MKNKFHEAIHSAANIGSLLCDLLELLVAAVTVLALCRTLLSLLPELGEMFRSGVSAHRFNEYLEELFTVVVGIEFLKLLCRPNSDNILEIMVFLVVRHMVLTSPSPLEGLLSSVTVILLVLLRRFLKEEKRGQVHLPFFTQGKEQEPEEDDIDS